MNAPRKARKRIYRKRKMELERQQFEATAYEAHREAFVPQRWGGATIYKGGQTSIWEDLGILIIMMVGIFCIVRGSIWVADLFGLFTK